MELFKNTNFDFLGKKWPFIIASLILTVAGLASLVVKGGPRYGIEFKGGMLMTVKFAGTPPLDQVRSSLTKVLPNPPSVETFENGSNEIAIGTEGGRRRYAWQRTASWCSIRWRRRSGIPITGSWI